MLDPPPAESSLRPLGYVGHAVSSTPSPSPSAPRSPAAAPEQTARTPGPAQRTGSGSQPPQKEPATSYRFLLSRRWLGLLLVVLLVSFACYELGRWQFHRYDERHQHNETIRHNETADPVALDQVMATDSAPADDDEYLRVRASGTYDVKHQLVVLYRTKDGQPGVDVVTPLVTPSGAAVLVDRGWISSAANGNQKVDAPAPPDGTVTIEGWVRQDSGDGGSRVTPSDGSVRSISSRAIAETVPYDLYQGFLELRSESPRVKPSPALADPPDLSGGPSFFYGIQWWFFGVLAIGFWVYFAYAERHPAARSWRHGDPDASDEPDGPAGAEVTGRE